MHGLLSLPLIDPRRPNRTLLLKSNKFKRFPPVVLRMRWLESLSLADNGMEELPDGVRSMTNLILLDIDNNRVTRLPHGLARL